MNAFDDLLRDLADDPADYDRQAGLVMLTRQGRDITLIIRDLPGVGPSVQVDGKDGSPPSFIPLAQYIQQYVFELPRLASQIIKTIDRFAKRRPAPYIDGPADYVLGGKTQNWIQTSSDFRRVLSEPEYGVTNLLQLMAGAGQGKTVLLEQVAREFALAYQPNPFPIPILLTVDLLGRYVGTVDDAIAGSLNNTYMFAGLTQRDIATCVKNRWMILALDGFDELVARIGARDAFVRITELLDQLRGSGTVVLSAREAFFELYQITAAIRSYLQPRVGTYSVSIVRLTPWTKVQGKLVFKEMGSSKPEEELNWLLTAFGNDTGIVLQPFLLTRLADLWKNGERFAGAQEQTGRLWRTRYIIERFIVREETKWISREGRLLLAMDGQTRLFAGIAEEMWRSGAFRLGLEELRAAASLVLESMGLSTVDVEAIVTRLPTHAALAGTDRNYAFVHERFLTYYVSVQLAAYLREGNDAALMPLLMARTLGPDVVDWVSWILRERDGAHVAIATLLSLSDENSDQIAMDNTAALTAKSLDKCQGKHEISHLTFSGDCFAACRVQGQKFSKCKFWQLDISGSVFQDCVFNECEFSDLHLDVHSSLGNTVFERCRFPMVGIGEDVSLFVPEAIERFLQERGARVLSAGAPARGAVNGPSVAPEVVKCVTRLIRHSERNWDISVEDEAEYNHAVVSTIVKIGLEQGILRSIEKGTSGPKKTFVRFRVDRQTLLKGQHDGTGSDAVDGFWSALAVKYPATRG